MRSSFMTALFAVVSHAFLAATAAAEPDPSDFDWTTIEPSSSLSYSPCYEDLKCAKLSLPLDWLDPVGNEARVVLAIVARPAVVDEDHSSFGGTIIVNPGGPSGSGVEFLLSAGDLIQKTADGKKKYEILSFDPRGVAFSTPNCDCHRNEFARGNAVLENRAMGPLDAGEGVVRRGMSRAAAFGSLCHESAGDNDIRRFMSTSSVARDMVEIVDKIDELRRVQANQVQRDQQNIELRSARDKSPARIQYWGFSYGTILGNYFASMFPGRVGRMILEGVEDVHDYANATWARNLQDAQKAFDHLWETCYRGAERCDLYHEDDRSPNDTRGRFDDFLTQLIAYPEPLVLDGSYHAITKDDIMAIILSDLYSPRRTFPSLATMLAEAQVGNFTAVAKRLRFPSVNESCSLQLLQKYTWNLDALSAVACGDGEPQRDLTVTEFEQYVQDLKADAPDFGAWVAFVRLSCTGWRFRPAYRFTGPWKTPEADANLVEGKPAAPLLFISSLYDPVTPHANAIEMSKIHPGSAVLVQDSVGHGCLGSPSVCREDYIKEYFETGKVREGQTMCKAECIPFDDCPRGDSLQADNLGDSLRPWGTRSPLEMFL